MRRVRNTAVMHCYKPMKSTTVIEIELALPLTGISLLKVTCTHKDMSSKTQQYALSKRGER
jgi:hypothetical protein